MSFPADLLLSPAKKIRSLFWEAKKMISRSEHFRYGLSKALFCPTFPLVCEMALGWSSPSREFDGEEFPRQDGE